MIDYTQYIVNKTMEEKWPIFIEVAQSVTKVLDKIERNITIICEIQYNETFVDFFVVLILINTFTVRWIILNLTGLIIRFLQYLWNKSNDFFDFLRINISNFNELISK